MAGQYLSPVMRGVLALLLAVSCLADTAYNSTGSSSANATTLLGLVRRQLNAQNIQCPGYSQRFQDPADCSRYYQCSFNVVTLTACPAGQNFNPGSQNCGNFAAPAGCVSRSGGAPSAPAADSYVCPGPNGNYPDTSDCTRYYVCSNSRAQRRNCPQGQYFDPNDEACSFSHDPEGCHKPFDNQPPPPAQGDYQCPRGHGNFPDSTDCSRFYVCDHWRYERKQCPPSQLYDPANEICSSSITPRGCHNVGDQSGFRCPTPNGNFQDPADCSRYWGCVNNQANNFQCPTNQLFDPNFSQCSASNNNRRPIGCIMPPNWNPGFTCPNAFGNYQEPSDCSRYWACDSFRQATSNQCPLNQLFDPQISQCSSTVTNPGGCTLPPGWNPRPIIPSGTGVPTCPMSDEASLIPHPRICNAFYVCGDGRLHRPCIFCGEGTYFDTTTSVCISDANVDFSRTCPGKVMMPHLNKVQAQLDGSC